MAAFNNYVRKATLKGLTIYDLIQLENAIIKPQNSRIKLRLLCWILGIFTFITLLPSSIFAQTPQSTPSSDTQTINARQLNDISARVDSLSRSLERLTFELNSEIKMTNARIEALKEASDRTFFVFIVLGAIGSAIGGFLAFQQIQQRRELHDKVLRIYETQAQIGEGYRQHQDTILNSQETYSRGISEITTSFRDILSDIKEVLGFRVEESKLAVEAMKAQAEAAQSLPKILTIVDDLQKERQNQIDGLLDEANRLIRRRNEYASPEPYLKSQVADFRTKMDVIPKQTLLKYTGADSEKPKESRYGELFLRRGIIAYYDNDPLKAKEVLSLAERFFPFSREQPTQMPDEQRYATAFTLFYSALLEKNYGDIRKAKSYIERSFVTWGKDENSELLTPVTYAEILSYGSADTDIEEARKLSEEVIKRADEVRMIKSNLASHEENYVHRAHLILGNIYYLQKKWQQALEQFEKAIGVNQKSYYAYHSVSQVLHKLGREEEAEKNLDNAYKYLTESRDLDTKVALDTLVLLNALAYLCLHKKNPDEAAKYHKATLQHLLKIQKLNGLELRLFSLKNKQQVDKDHFLDELTTE